jgi:hypothetical protein
MKCKKVLLLAFLVYFMVSSACVYIVLPEGLEEKASTKGSENKGWSAIVTNVGQSEAGDLHVDIAIRNDTGDWSTMQAAEGKPATLTASDGKTTPCDSVYIGTGGHRFAPGFQMRGYTAGTTDKPEIQRLYVECKGVTAAAGQKLSIDYVSFNGILDDYDPEANKIEGQLELNLDEVVVDLSYPVAAPVEGLILEAGKSITGLSDNVVTLLDTQRSGNGFTFTWQNFNPTKFPLRTHIGIPPVIGADGIIYGIYETLDMAPVPITPANDKMQWSTEVAVLQDVKGCYILLSVESNKPRTYKNYVLDVSNK